jgi:leader peptidase (prepilin peptidase)/N-methyltransferase
MGAGVFVPILVFSALVWASVSDIRTRQVPDKVSVMIALVSLMGVTDIFFALAGILSALPLLVAALVKPGSVGGADIKIMAATGLFLGCVRGLTALCIGLILAVICTFIIRKLTKTNLKEAFPLVPYLSVGCVIANFF